MLLVRINSVRAAIGGGGTLGAAVSLGAAGPSPRWNHRGRGKVGLGVIEYFSVNVCTMADHMIRSRL